MGSTAALGSEPEEFTVLITGFGPFKEQHPQNPSWEIASQLPEYLPAAKSKPTGKSPPLPPVRLLVHPEPVRVSYTAVRELVPRLWELDRPDRRIHLALHIGMAGPRPYYSIERLGHRDGYAMKDVDGVLLGDRDRQLKEGKDWIWHGIPKELETDLDLDDVLKRWKQYSPDAHDLQISDDPGRYLCDFIYFSSLAHLWKAKTPKLVTFLHVPSESSDKAIAVGRELTLELVRAIVESQVARKQFRTR